MIGLQVEPAKGIGYCASRIITIIKIMITIITIVSGSRNNNNMMIMMMCWMERVVPFMAVDDGGGVFLVLLLEPFIISPFPHLTDKFLSITKLLGKRATDGAKCGGSLVSLQKDLNSTYDSRAWWRLSALMASAAYCLPIRPFVIAV